MNYKEVIESKYNRQNWQLLLHDIFGNKIKFWNTPSTISTSSQFAKQALWLGTITLSDDQTISVYEVELSDSVDIERNRRGIRDMLLTDWRNNGNAGAFMFCYRKNESVLRFSYVSEAWTFADDGSYQKESTDAKRFTYLLGEGHRSRTAIQQFEKLRDSSLTLKDLTKAFSVDAVSDMFFDGYKKQYEDIIQYITGKRMVKVANKWEEQIKNEPCEEIMQEFAHFPNPEKAVRDYVKKLMGRLVFLQFLQKKGWLGVPAGEPWGTGDREFIQNLFGNCQDKDHFVDNVLEPLFDDLNTEREGDNSQLSILNYQFKLPYLNGGLFERDATDETEFPLPAKYMQSLLDFFASYNFTIDENDPDDAEVGVDPEMLGRIFENLLEDNKDKGAFYTPKEIVSYMCRESLIAYLQTGIEDEATKEAIRQFVTTHDVNALGANDRFRQQVDEALCNVKICDPAIGSGAFPMGLLKELFQCRTALEGITQSKAAEIKKHIIQQNIYGVDIERGAVDIARLRFWLSLIVDEETPQALPNLDFKIMQGNSLLEQYKGVDLSAMTEKKYNKSEGLSFFDNMVDVYRKDLRDMLAKYYNCTNHKEKKELRTNIINNVKKQLAEQRINANFGDLDLSGNNQFFLWHTWFYDVFSQGGFDIVIGNPPYVSAVNMARTELEKRIYKSVYPQASGAYDLYILFLLQGIKLSNNTFCWIIPNKLHVADYARQTLEELTNNGLYSSLDVSIFNVFKEASVYPIIINGSKQNNWRYGRFSLDQYADLLKNKKVKQQDILINETILSSGIKVCSGATGFEAQKIKEFVHDHKVENSIPFTVSGNIDRYYYDNKNVRYMKDRYSDAYVYLDGSFSKGKVLLWSNPKIIIAGMTKVVEATYVQSSLAIGVGAYAIYDFNGFNPYYILGLLNSKYTSYYLMNKFRDKHLAGGYLAINKSTIEQLPFKIAEDESQTIIINNVKTILKAKSANLSADTTALESEIDRLVYQLYGLTEEEIKIVEQS
ncbi:MAG: Eco57I restriction-modification methylase domain-containing protein [Prevotella sp.]|nr:Eco57I restriction-modification methylase domain-containing protein [Prevotella sp.]